MRKLDWNLFSNLWKKYPLNSSSISSIHHLKRDFKEEISSICSLFRQKVSKKLFIWSLISDIFNSSRLLFEKRYFKTNDIVSFSTQAFFKKRYKRSLFEKSSSKRGVWFILLLSLSGRYLSIFGTYNWYNIRDKLRKELIIRTTKSISRFYFLVELYKFYI